MITTDELEHRIEAIEQRNKRVESEKAWETSLTRMMLIGLMTYAVAAMFLFFAHLPQPLINACIPALGFMLSLQSLPVIKRQWMRSHR